MAAPSGQFKPAPYFITLGLLIAVLYSAVLFFGKSPTPKLGLDLQGGTSLTMTAVQIAGGKPVTGTNLQIARDIINQRVDSLGVNQANVVVEGKNIVVSVAGKNANKQNLEQLAQQAKLEFRTVINSTPDQSAAAAAAIASPSAAASGSAAPKPSASGTPKAQASPSPSAKSNGDAPAAAPSPSASTAVGPAAPAPAASTAAPAASATPTESTAPNTAASGSGITPLADVQKKVGAAAYAAAQAITDPTQVTTAQVVAVAPFAKLSSADVAALPPTMQFAVPTISCAQLNGRIPGVLTTDKAQQVQVVSCDQTAAKTGETKYLLDGVKVHGEDVGSASFAYDLTNYQGWYVQLQFKGKGQSQWADLTGQLYRDYQSSGTYRQVAIVLDNVTVTAPNIQGAIDGPAIISGGGMTKDSAKLLSTQLKFGALPVSFIPQDTVNVSATLGLAQMKAGLLAGGIGLALVVLYCLFYYRALGLVVIASLVVSASIIYAAIVLLGRSSIGFTLSLAGIAGFIVAIGVTADSFVVFFERLKDEVRDGKTARSSVPRAWVRARRTILSADAVSLIAAGVLLALASGPISGFAFTLGLSTLIDLVVVFLFTHPIVSVLSGSKTFTSPRFSGLGELRRSRSDSAAPASRLGMQTKES